MSKCIKKSSFSKICRICLTHNLEMIAITPKIIRKIKACSSVKVKLTDGLPSHVCIQCHEEINKFSAFKSKCENSDRLLKKILAEESDDDGDSEQEVGLKSENGDADDTAENNFFKDELKINYEDSYVQCNDSKDTETDTIKSELKVEDESLNCNNDNYVQFDDSKISKRDISELQDDKPEETHPCQVCNKILRSEYSLLRHMRMQGHDGDKKYICEMCKESFYKLRALSEHMKVHGVEPLICPVCKKQFMLKVQLEIHRKFHDKFSCQQCGKVFKNANNLNRHKVTHSSETPFKCSQCSKSFKSESYLINHTKLIHYGIKRRSVCTVCGISVAHIKQHLLVHEGLKPFKCTECDASFMTGGHLNAHARKHSGEIGIFGTVCTICGKKCRHSTQLRIHMRKHTGERPHVCSYCSKAYKTGSALTVHIRSAHTGERPHLCSMCSKTFTTSDTLKQHIRTHTGERPFVCQICGRGFTQRHALKTHMKIHNSGC